MNFNEYRIQSNEKFNDELNLINIINSIIDLLSKVDSNKISDESSCLIDLSSAVNLSVRLIPNSKDNCPIFIELYDFTCEVQLRKGAKYISLEEINDFTKLRNILLSIEDILGEKIGEISYWSSNEEKGGVLITNHNIDGNIVEHKVPYGKTLFFRKFLIDKKEKIYESWY